MKINDRIYGEIEIEAKLATSSKESVLVELIQSKPFQRLKKINQYGAAHFIQPIRNVTRYEHSIGVWYLSSRYSRPIEEQIASLLHDIPHTAFSHVIDLVVNDEKHEFHERFTKEIILNSEIPEILKKHKVNIDKVLEKEDLPLLENDLPDISVDRWDYFMRDGYMMGFLPQSTIREFLDGIYFLKQNIPLSSAKKRGDSGLQTGGHHLLEDKFYFKDVRLASLSAILFVNFSRLIWLDPTSHGSYFLIAEAIKIALKKGFIVEKDFFTDDEVLMTKLKASKDPDINSYLNRLKPGKEFIYASKEDAEFYGPNKPRCVDPLVKTKKGLQRVSELVPSLDYFFKEFSENHKYLGVTQQF